MSRTHFRTLVAASTVAACLSLAACAHDPRPDGPSSATATRTHLQELDRNGDNFLTPDELEANHRLALEFSTWDTDGDGRISEAEFFAYVDATTD
ncbi:MAG: hypothetical protein A2579_02200 [Lysobacterales bacterium RIFOXYD1_FULL_69_11]|nr:MAG: hypothetical protein A2190_05245 [Xanthomonadales bacterium RIFOXYA1_FULL_69_10]OHE88659.1 MAG: hypothetical protein A2579_02200 [Xanthomonadales bacterium RIFOXYD1_FULL_69_11]